MNEKDQSITGMAEVPSWLFYVEDYTPPKDHDRFIQKSILSIMGAMSRIKVQCGKSGRLSLSPEFKIAAVLVVIILMAFSHNSAFEYCVIAGILVVMCTLDSHQIVSILKAGSIASIFAALVLLPAILLMGNKQSILIIIKVFATVSMVALLSRQTQWNQLTAALRTFRIPAVVVMILDLTLKYIVMFGELCVELLEALRIRSIGHNRGKYASLSGILGVTFLKSKEMSEEMYQAMVCRGFTGDYPNGDRPKPSWKWLVYSGFFIALGVLFWMLEMGET